MSREPAWLQLAFLSFHNNQKLVRSRLAQFHIGHIVEEEQEVRLHGHVVSCERATMYSSPPQHPEISKDFLKLRQDFIDQVGCVLELFMLN